MAQSAAESAAASVRPAVIDAFPAGQVKAIARDVLTTRLAPSSGATSGTATVEYSSDLAKHIADEVKRRVRDLKVPRYKVFVTATVGEQRGEGAHAAARCLWDTVTDTTVSESVITDALWGTVAVFGVYTY